MLIPTVLSSYQRMALIAPVQKQFTSHRNVFLHAAWLDQISIHCPIFLTAASRRSLDRVSVPVWGTSLSGPLNIVDMVCRYHTIYLMLREPIRILRKFKHIKMPPDYPPDAGMLLTRYAPLRRSPASKPESSDPLPLDLHVLSLPLAFILSQDQTLHCIIFYFSSAWPDYH